MKKWTKVKDELPQVHASNGFDKSIKVAVLVSEKEPFIAELNRGIDEDGVMWIQWYSQAYEDTIDNVTHWCYLPDYKNLND